MERQPHNNLWAEKLLQVSMPDSAEAWSGMEALLDKKMPRRAWSDWRRWVLLILLLLLLIGVCNCPGRGRLFHGEGSTRINTPSSTRTNAPGVARTNTPNTPGTSNAPSAGTARAHTPGVVQTNTPGSSATPTNPASTASPTQPASTPAYPTTLATQHTHPGPVPPTASTPHPVIFAATHTARKTTTHTARKTTTQTGSKTATHTSPKIPRTHQTPRRTRASRHTPGNPSEFGDITQNTPDDTGDTSTSPTTGSIHRTYYKNTTAKWNLPPVPGPAPLRPAAHKDSTHKKSLPPQEPGKNLKDHGWVFGVGLNQFFPIGGQRGATYNSNGLTGTLTDYLPVPMARYYFNEKIYIQAEVQFNTPQPTAKNLVISQPAQPDTATRNGVFTQTTSSASIQQLYYFNIPLSLHFNFWDNLNIGTGLQWSHLSNAIGEFDSSVSSSANGNTPTVVDAKNNHSLKGDDSLYSKIKTNELRFLIDANYTYKHIVFGLRYNQALSRFVNLQLPNGSTTQGRNSSLQLYLRYILWDTRKKKPPPKLP